ncbi:TlpA disulfide reductase family protein [Mucilaginibacter kameinonensis]|uniref:TlpA disulfide reductase family protein n=1 Tax=Mucilaginibacter kameinonensis TaxID=452286 RepID=UPI000EF7C026|nr:TlpA disulfide reductase family protein [Mucilaginibacter kameinonensis]
MQLRIFLALCFLPIMTWAQNSKFVLNVKADLHSKVAKAYLIYRSGEKIIIDSVPANNNHFQLTDTLSEPVMAQLVLDHDGVGLDKLGRGEDLREFYLESANIDVSVTDSVRTASITGSKSNDEYEFYTNSVAEAVKAINRVYMAFSTAPAGKKNDKTFMDSLQTKLTASVNGKRDLQKQFIIRHPGSYISLVVMKAMFGDDIDVTVAGPLFKNLSPEIRLSPSGISYSAAIDKARLTAIGATAPAFTAKDVHAKTIGLKNFRGKYVLLDFWASWCRPCRAENPNLLKAYRRYKNQRFNVLGISLDTKQERKQWLAAIKKDGMPWRQIADPDVVKMYDVHGIPQNFLVDPTGKIIAKNLRGDELNKALANIFK